MIKNLNSFSKLSEIPAQFTNNIFFSEDSRFEGYKYESVYSLKYVISGFEEYLVNGNKKSIKPNQYLLVNNKNEVISCASSGKGISIFIKPEIIMDVTRSLYEKDENLIINPFENKDNIPFCFYENVYTIGESQLTNYLHFLTSVIVESGIENLKKDESIFIELAESIIVSQQDAFPISFPSII